MKTLSTVLLMAPILLAGPCVRLDSGQISKAKVASTDRTCFQVVVSPGEAALLSLEQPVDLAFHIEFNGAASTIDGFSFSRETATLETAGEYRVEVRAVLQSRTPPPEIAISRSAISPSEASPRRVAEELSTRSKRTGKSEDIEASIKAWQAAGDSWALARARLDQGDVALAAGDLAAARGSYEGAREGCLAAHDTRCVAEAANNSGLAAQQAGDFDAATERLNEAASALREIGEPVFEGQTFSNLGLLYRQAGDYQRAIGYYDRARTILKARNPVAYARVLNNLGVCYQSLADYGVARDYFEKALADFQEHHSWRDALRSRLNLGRNYMLEGDAAKARKILEQALNEATLESDAPGRGDVLSNLGQALLGEHKTAVARTTLEAALEIHRTTGDRRMQAIDLHTLGLAAVERGDPAAARSELTRAYEIRQECGLRDASVDSLFALADLERSAGNVGGARELAGRGIATLEAVRSHVPGPELRASYYARERRFLDLLVDLEADVSAENGLLAAEQGRARALMDLLARGTLLGQVPADLQKRREAVQRRIDLLALRLATAPADRMEGLRNQVELLVSENQGIEARIREQLSSEKLGYKLRSVAEFQSLLPSESAVIEYHLGERRSYLWLIERKSIRTFSLPKRAAVEERCAAALELFGDIQGRRRSPEKQRRFKTAIRELSAILLGPIRNVALPPRVMIVPDGVLTRVPFAALEISNNQRMGLAHDLVELPSGAFLAAGPKPNDASAFPRAVLAVADPVYSTRDPRAGGGTPGATDPGLSRLPFSNEVETIAGLVPERRRTILRGFDANANAIERLRLNEFGVLHFSAHALIDDRIPELSRIALSMVDRAGAPVDGFVRPYQLAHWRLNGSTVVFSACETALGKQVLGEGLLGFTASLFFAGAAQLVLTLSDVDAEGSAEFFSEVYRHLLAARPEPIDRSLTLARRGLSQSARWKDPYYWASFMVYGVPAESRSLPPGFGKLE
jgi:CHAT domain-containing protein/tetratricopeptide (TPR) repeat protein